MSNFLEKLGIVEKDPKTVGTSTPVIPQQTPTTNPINVQSTLVQPHTEISTGGTIDKKFIDHFTKLLEDANLPGPDYYEFAQALDGLKDSGLSEQQMFNSTWTIFKSMGGSALPSALVVAANAYLEILNKDKSNFEKDVKESIEEKVGNLTHKISSLEDENAKAEQTIIDLQKTINDKIVELQSKINTNVVEIEKASNDIHVQTAKLQTNDKNYHVTFDKFVEQIKNDITKIQTYLK